MGHFNKKFVVLTFIILIIFLVLPKSASAYTPIPVIETNMILLGAETATAEATAGFFGEQVYEWLFKIAAEALKRQLLDMIVDQIVMWIQGGGEPKFVTDWPGFFQDAVDQAGGKFIQQIGLSRFCSPFKPLLSAAFIPIAKFSDRTSCTLSQIGVNIDDFLEDFNQGGWVAWNEMILKPQNNIYGAYLMAWDQYEIEKSAADKAATAEAQAGRGFLSARRCVEYNTEGYNDCVASGLSEAECKKASCTKEEIITPGAVAGDLAAKAVGSDIDYIVNAQDFEAYVAAIVNAILNRIFAEGVGLLHAGSSSDSGGGTSGGGTSGGGTSGGGTDGGSGGGGGTDGGGTDGGGTDGGGTGGGGTSGAYKMSDYWPKPALNTEAFVTYTTDSASGYTVLGVFQHYANAYGEYYTLYEALREQNYWDTWYLTINTETGNVFEFADAISTVNNGAYFETGYAWGDTMNIGDVRYGSPCKHESCQGNYMKLTNHFDSMDAGGKTYSDVIEVYEWQSAFGGLWAHAYLAKGIGFIKFELSSPQYSTSRYLLRYCTIAGAAYNTYNNNNYDYCP